MDFTGKVAIVTGAGGGIGEGYANAFAARGMKVVVAELNAEGGERVRPADFVGVPCPKASDKAPGKRVAEGEDVLHNCVFPRFV